MPAGRGRLACQSSSLLAKCAFKYSVKTTHFLYDTNLALIIGAQCLSMGTIHTCMGFETVEKTDLLICQVFIFGNIEIGKVHLKKTHPIWDGLFHGPA